MSDGESTDAVNTMSKRTKRRLVRDLVAIVLMLMFLALVVLIWLDPGPSTSSGSKRGGPPPSLNPEPSETPDVAYGATDQLCAALDFDEYTELIGTKPTPQFQQISGMEGEGIMQCQLTSRDRDAAIRDCEVFVVVEQYESSDEADMRYGEDLKNSKVSKSKMDPSDGPWDQVVSHSTKGGYEAQYSLDVQEDNLTLSLTQTVTPVDAIDTNEANGLMSGYAEQILTEVHN